MYAPQNDLTWGPVSCAAPPRRLIATLLAAVVWLALAPAGWADVFVPNEMPSHVINLQTNQEIPLNAVMTLSSSLPAIGATGAQQKYPFITGAGQTVAVIDTGIDYTHPALASQYLGGWDFGNGDSNPMDTQGHGTHVAGIAVANSTLYGGVAPGAKVVALKVMNDQTGVIDESNIVSALNWVAANAAQYHITAVNISLGDSGSYKASDINPFYEGEQALRQLKSMGIFVAAAAGNDGHLHGLGYPAASPNIVSVGGTWANNDYSGYAFGWDDPYQWNAGSGPVPSRMVEWGPRQNNIMVLSNRYSTANDGKLDLLAPGAVITSTYPMALDTADGTQDGWTDLLGTSMASPQVAAASMLIRQALMDKGLLDPDPAKQVDQILQILKDTGKPLVDASAEVMTENGPAGDHRNRVQSPLSEDFYANLYIRPGTDATYPLIDLDAAISMINPIPEPATMGLLVLGAVGILLRRRRRKL